MLSPIELSPREIINIIMHANMSHTKNICGRGLPTVQNEPNPGHHLSCTRSNARLEEQGGISISVIFALMTFNGCFLLCLICFTVIGMLKKFGHKFRAIFKGGLKYQQIFRVPVWADKPITLN